MTTPASLNAEGILGVINEIAKRELRWNGSVERDTRLVEGLGLDSVRRLVLVVELEDRFRVRLDEEDEAALLTAGDLVDLIQRKQRETTHAG